MTHESLLNRDWQDTVDRLGGAERIEAWAASVGLADISNVALLNRLRQCADWLAVLIGHVLAQAAPESCQGRLIRVIDGSAVAKAGKLAKKNNGVWRIHSAFDLPSERFGHVELTDESGGETLDGIPVVKGEIRLGDLAHLQPHRLSAVLTAGGDVVVRAGWKSARWLDANGEPLAIEASVLR